MELAIGTGDPGLVASFLHSLDKTSAASQLTGCYGGRYLEVEGRGAQRDANEHGLVPMTTPLLHAARTGSTAMFSAVFSAMRDRLWAKQVRNACPWVCGCGVDILVYVYVCACVRVCVCAFACLFVGVYLANRLTFEKLSVGCLFFFSVHRVNQPINENESAAAGTKKRSAF